jgi:hypothetical protein
MSPANQESYSVLAIDIGTVHTRALLFDVVEESYRFIAAGVTLSTGKEPLSDYLLGVLDSIRQLQNLTGRTFLSQSSSLIIPTQMSGEGIDRVYVTYSVGHPLRIATFGLMSDVSLQSVNKLAATVSGNVLESISLNDSRLLNQQIDDVVKARPELILFAGGTDRGATRSVKKMADLIISLLQVIPERQRPPVVYSGNQLLVKQVKEMIGAYTRFSSTANIRPEMDSEELESAAEDLAHEVTELREREIDGLKQLSSICNDLPSPSTTTIGRITTFLSKVGDPEKGVLSINLGASKTVAASALNGKLALHTLPIGSGQGFEAFLKTTPFAEIERWLPASIDPESARNLLWQKTVFPNSIPETSEALLIEQAAYRQLLRWIVAELNAREALCPNGYETILCSGMALTQASTPSQLLMMLLDGLQPSGLTTLILDSHSILSTLGAISRTLPLLPVQVLESPAFTNLATVVSARSNLRPGALALKARMEYGEGKSREIEVKQGSLAVLPLRTGESASLELELTRGVQVEAIDLADTHYKINGGLCGLIIDARGRPLKLPQNPAIRSELFSRWQEMLDAK